MSIRTTDYVLNVADEVDQPGARFVLLALSARANSTCGCTFGGEWLREFTGYHAATVRRHLDTLESAGLIALRRRVGRAPVVRFPLAGFIHSPAHSCGGCRAWNRADPAHDARDPAHDARQPRAQCAPYLEGNREVNRDRSTVSDTPNADVGTVRQIWKKARDQARAEATG